MRGVTLDHAERLAQKTMLQKRGEFLVLFNRNNRRSLPEERIREHSKTRPDFQNSLSVSNVRRVEDCMQDALIHQKMLAQSLFRRCAEIAKNFTDIRRFHHTRKCTGEFAICRSSSGYGTHGPRLMIYETTVLRSHDPRAKGKGLRDSGKIMPLRNYVLLPTSYSPLLSILPLTSMLDIPNSRW